MRKEALIGISVLLVMVSGSATVLNSFGVISGEANVEGPTFWAGSGSHLYLEEQTGQTSTTDRAEFVYDLSSEAEWYDLNAVMTAKVAENDDSNEIKVMLNFQGLDSEENIVAECDEKVSETVSANYDSGETGVANTVNGNCEVNFDQDIDAFRYVIETDDGGDMALQRYGDTKVEVSSQ